MRFLLAACAVVFVACAPPAEGEPVASSDQNIDEGVSADDVYGPADAIALTISAPLSTLFARRSRNEVDPAPAVNEFSEPGSLVFQHGGVETRLDARFYIRGESSLYDCPFNKLKIELTNKPQLEGTPFKGHGKMRFNTHCGPGDKSARSRMGRVFNGVGPVREELVYRVIRGAGIPTYLTRVAKVHYDDTADGSQLDSFGMIMESGNDAAQRFVKAGVIPADAEYLSPQDANRGVITAENTARIVVAEAFAGNADWFGTHNIDSFGKVGVAEMFRIPQDFDLGAIVQADIQRYRIAKIEAAQPGLANATVKAELESKAPAMRAALEQAKQTAIAAGAIDENDPGFAEAAQRIEALFALMAPPPSP